MTPGAIILLWNNTSTHIILLFYYYIPTRTWYTSAVPVNALQPSDTDGCAGSRTSLGSDSVSSISDSSEAGSGSGPRLERGRLGLETRARARVHIVRTREQRSDSWYCSRYLLLLLLYTIPVRKQATHTKSNGKALPTCYGHRSFHARCCLSACSANSACSLSDSGFIVTASAASLSSFSEDTLVSIYIRIFYFHITALQRRIINSCELTAFVPLLQRSVRRPSDVSKPPRRTASSWAARPATLWMVSTPVLAL